MIKPFRMLVVFLLVGFFAAPLFAQLDFYTSLHATRQGKATWYSKENGGFEKLTQIPIESLACQKCHAPTYASGEPVDDARYTPVCNDCHDFTQGITVAQTTCLGCHTRQGAEINLSNNPATADLFSDVHRDKGMECKTCHTRREMHGDGTSYASFLEPGATDASCENCHNPALLPENPAHEQHLEDIYCAACHVKTVVSCYNCHFETEVQAEKKRFYGPPPIHGFVMLVNSEKHGKITTASFQSVTFGDTTFYAVGPFNGHTVTKEARDCDECHNNANVKGYNETGKIVVTKWDDAQDKITNAQGVIPVPEDWQTAFKLDFVRFKGAPGDPVDASLDPAKWEYMKTGADASQMLYATPLSGEQMDKLSLAVPSMAAFQKSVHATRNGKSFWYAADTSVTHAPAPGFESLTGVPNDADNLACNSCHSATNLDANGDPYPAPYPGANCVDCHATKTEGMPVSEDACLSCHSRQKATWASLGYSDVHRGEYGMKCWDCHSLQEVHGDGNEYNSILEAGAMTTACENCHATEENPLPAGHSPRYDPHNGKISCEACHTQSVISCYNCHFDSQVESQLKRPKQTIDDFVILVNREKDGKVAPATFQSLSYQDKTWMAMAPFNAHTTVKEGRRCYHCHNNFGGEIEAINQYNSTGRIQFTTWNEADSTLGWMHGVIPLPADYEKSFKMDFLTYNGNTDDAVAPSKNWSKIKDNWDGHQLFFASPLTFKQMANIGYDTTATTAVNDYAGEKQPDGFALEQNYPNPFNPTTTIQFTLPYTSKVTLRIYTVLGEEVRTVYANTRLEGGLHKVPFDASGLSTGLYIYRLTASGFTESRKMIIMK